MTSLEWSPNLGVGIDFMEKDHKQLIALVGELDAMLSPERYRMTVVEKLDELVAFTRQHFHLEERVMAQSGYPELEQHREGHEALLRQIVDFRERFAAGEAITELQVMDFLKDWLVGHISESDKHLGEFLQKRLSR